MGPGFHHHLVLSMSMASWASLTTSFFESFNNGSIAGMMLLSPNTARVRHASRLTLLLELLRQGRICGMASGASLSRKVFNALITSLGLSAFKVSQSEMISGSVMVVGA